MLSTVYLQTLRQLGSGYSKLKHQTYELQKLFNLSNQFAGHCTVYRASNRESQWHTSMAQFLGGLSLHLNHLIQSCMEIS